MSENKKPKATAEAATATKKSETKFKTEDILNSPKVFNTSRYILEGALHNKGDEFTKNEVKKLTDEFLKQEVK